VSKKKEAELNRQVLEYRLDESLGFMITITERRLKKLLGEVVAYEGFNSGFWFFLRTLFEEDGLTQKELSDRVGMRQPTTVKALRGMAERGFVRIEADPNDRRAMRIHLTDEGRRIGARILPMLKELNRFALQGVTQEEFKTLRAILRKVRNNLDAGGFDPRPRAG
jgi:DNA-binding MarR family transcriptional regulator